MAAWNMRRHEYIEDPSVVESIPDLWQCSSLRYKCYLHEFIALVRLLELLSEDQEPLRKLS